MKKIKVLVVDDSVLFRSQVTLALKEIPFIEVCGAASHGRIALEKAINLDIDLFILDIEMPEMDGLETLREIQRRNLKTKAIMFSSVSQTGADKTLEAMKLGALDFVAKPVADDRQLTPHMKIRESLLPKLESIFGFVAPPVAPRAQEEKYFDWGAFTPEILVVASSTGGPNALEEFFSQLKIPMSIPILVTQHMPPVFTSSLARRLGEISGKKSAEALHGEPLLPDHIYVAPGNFHMSIAGTKLKPVIQLDQRDQRNYVRPCADFLFESAAALFHTKTLGVVLTGMGRDGADGAKAIKTSGGGVMIQDEASCVVFGMPGAVFAEHNYDFMGTPRELGNRIVTLLKSRKGHYVA